jgi:hypothetical protein
LAGPGKYNQELVDLWDELTIEDVNASGVPIRRWRFGPSGEICDWFDPRRINKIPMSKHYPDLAPLNDDPKFCLLDNYPNYTAILLIDTLFSDRKETVCIEDSCCGQGKLAYYLSKLGFKKFSFWDNFSQISPQLLLNTMYRAGIDYSLNQPVEEIMPVVFTQFNYPLAVRTIAKSVELACIYDILETRSEELGLR